MGRGKISILAANCTIHSLARPRLLAQLLGAHYEVEVVAPVFPGDEDVYATSRWPGRYVPVPVRQFPGFARSVGDLMDALTGDVVYACKPKATSLGVGLLHRRQRHRPLVVDVDDHEIYHCYPYSRHAVKNLLLSLPTWAHPDAYLLTLAMEPLVRQVDHVTSVSTFFQRKFGGTIVPQAVDTDLFDPALYNRAKMRRGCGLEGFRVVLFLGRPQPHKGLEEILGAVQRSRHDDVRLVVVGGGTPYTETLRSSERAIVFGPQPFEMAPSLLAMADVVMVPQRVGLLSAGQMPTKIPEAMAMGVPVIATAVSDIPVQVGDGGMVVPPGNVGVLAEALDRLLDDAALVERMGAAARQRAIDHLSMQAVRPTLEGVFKPYVEG